MILAEIVSERRELGLFPMAFQYGPASQHPPRWDSGNKRQGVMLHGLGDWWNPTTWFSSDTSSSSGPAQPDAQTQGLFDEIQQLGRVGTTCKIREMQTLALKHLAIKNYALKVGKTDVAAECDDARAKLNSAVEDLYAAIDAWMGGEWGKEAPVPGNACLAGYRQGLGVAPLVAVGVGLLAVIALGGIVATIAYYTSNAVRLAVAAGFCAMTDSTAKCQAAMAAAAPPAEPTWYSEPLKIAAIGGVVLVGGYLVWKFVEARMTGSAIASGIRGSLRGLPRHRRGRRHGRRG